MKTSLHKSIFILSFLFLLTVSLKSQSLSEWFDVKEVADKVWLIDDHNAVNIYLIEGKDSALIIDTGMGAADLSSLVKKLTNKPVIVVNTHGHPDHVGANYQFEKVYVHPADSTATRMLNLIESRKQSGEMMLAGAVPPEGELYKDKELITKLIPVKEGYKFKLGGRTIQVIETPAHTAGSICLLDIENKLFFTGDNNNDLVWLFLEGCLPLSVYLKSLEKQALLISEYNIIFPGHGEKIKSEFVLDEVECVKSILNGTCKSKPYKSFAGEAKICSYGKAKVAYDPNNL